MKFDFLKNKVFIISFIVLILFSFFNCSVFADSSFDPNYDYLYKFKIDNNLDIHCSNTESIINSTIDDNNKDDRIVSGDYYYFIFSDWDGLANVFIKKSVINNIYLSYHFTGQGVPFYGFFCDGITSDDVFLKSGTWQRYDLNVSRICTIIFNCDYDNKILTTNFVTNYPGNIPVLLKNGSTCDFFAVAPTFHLTEAVGQIPEIMTKIIKQVLPIGLIVLGVGLLIYLTRRVIFLMK